MGTRLYPPPPKNRQTRGFLRGALTKVRRAERRVWPHTHELPFQLFS